MAHTFNLLRKTQDFMRGHFGAEIAAANTTGEETVASNTSVAEMASPSGRADENIIPASVISLDDVMPGDILLLQYDAVKPPEKEREKIVELVFSALRCWQHWGSYTEEEKKEKFAELMPLIHFAIKEFDGDQYFHAAIVGVDGDDKRTVIEAGTEGINCKPLTDYWKGPISVYRYQQPPIALGDPSLPAEPVLETANGYFTGPDIKYGYSHAGLLAIWCLFRSGEDVVMARLKQTLAGILGEKAVDLLFSGKAEVQIKLLLVNLFHMALDYWRKDNQMVCSELVASCFNNADDEGTYRISRELDPKKIAKPSLGPIKPLFLDEGLADKQVLILREALLSLELERPLRSIEVALELVDKDILYTPRDLKNSINTFHVGNMGKHADEN
ncbi:MAG: hypothetical protein AB3N28_04170 [Kordiimonas sp.]